MAILAVFAYHSGTFLRGSFIGSTFCPQRLSDHTLLLQEWAGTGSIAIGDFYRRRAARLLPALFVTVAGVAVIYATYPPLQLDVTSSSARGARGPVLREQLVPGGRPPLVGLARPHLVTGDRGAVLSDLAAASSALPAAVLVTSPASAPYGVTRVCERRSSSRSLEHAQRRNIYFRPIPGPTASCWAARSPLCTRWPRVVNSSVGIWAAGIGLGFAAALALLVFAVKFTPGDRFVYNAGLAGVNVCTAVIVAHVVCSERSLLTKLLSIKPVVWIGARSYGIILLSTSRSSPSSVRVGSATSRAVSEFRFRSPWRCSLRPRRIGGSSPTLSGATGFVAPAPPHIQRHHPNARCATSPRWRPSAARRPMRSRRSL